MFYYLLFKTRLRSCRLLLCLTCSLKKALFKPGSFSSFILGFIYHFVCMCLCWFEVFFRELCKLGKREQGKNAFTGTMETNQAMSAC